MEPDHRRTMADRHDRRPRQPARQDAAELRLELLVDSGRRFVEEQPVRPHQERARNPYFSISPNPAMIKSRVSLAAETRETARDRSVGFTLILRPTFWRSHRFVVVGANRLATLER